MILNSIRHKKVSLNIHFLPPYGQKREGIESCYIYKNNNLCVSYVPLKQPLPFRNKTQGFKMFSFANKHHSLRRKKMYELRKGGRKKKIDFDKTIKTFASCFIISALL